jgi:hypothetical protein
MLGAGAALAAFGAAVALAGASPADAVRVRDAGAPLPALRGLADHYRTLTWRYQRAAGVAPTHTSFAYRRSSDRTYLRWAIDVWTRRAYRARRGALAAVERRLPVSLPHAPGLRVSPRVRVAYSKRLIRTLRRIYPGGGGTTRTLASARPAGSLQAWQRRTAKALATVAAFAKRQPDLPGWLEDAFLCIHRYEGAWDADTGNGYYGGLQMDRGFMAAYGADFARRWGTADAWPRWAQLEASVRAYSSGRGFRPWPNTARLCGLL